MGVSTLDSGAVAHNQRTLAHQGSFVDSFSLQDVRHLIGSKLDSLIATQKTQESFINSKPRLIVIKPRDVLCVGYHG